ncbi:MAG TPA: VOC family protein [Candidatus Saccharimonadales bacterium]|jgi:catechol 2,3-dioxygenase-like lactoylglutathione lyase family enzyme|nr:VOC family protein [Candidatus Saccharimonadales bacterium]
MALFKQVDAAVLHVDNLEAGLDFYCSKLGQKLKWRNDISAGLELGESELVLSTALDAETDILVESVDEAVKQIAEYGGIVVVAPEDIPVGRVAVVKDPFGNVITLVDLSKGTYKTDDSHNVTGVA